MRAFVAIELPASIQDILYRTSLDLGERIDSRTAVSWTKPENIHLTLQFLGEIQPELIPQLGQAIDLKAALLPIFELELNELGCFPNPNNPRIIWVGIAGDTILLNQLQAAIEEASSKFGWKPERRRFHPHLTIGRVRARKPVTEAKLPYGGTIGSPSFSVKSVSLVESILKPAGASYKTRYCCPLQAMR